MNTTSTETKIIKLEAGMQIKTPYDKYSPVIEVNTSKNFSKDGTHIQPDGTFDTQNKIDFHFEGWKIWEANCGRDWKRHYVWANQRAACLTAWYPGKDEEMVAKAKRYEEALVLDDGDIVEVDGMLFEVYCIKRDVSDPVHFTYIREAE